MKAMIGNIQPPTVAAPPPDPMLDAVKAQAQGDRTAALAETLKMDTSNLLTRYGAKLAMAFR